MPKSIYFLFLLLTPSWAVQQSGTVRSGGFPIPGATVTAAQGEQKIVTTTDDGGQYTLNNLPAGAWTLQVDIFGFTTARRQVTIDDKASSLEWTLELKPLSTSVPNIQQPTSKIQNPTSAPRVRAARPSQAPAGGRQNSGGFQNLSLNDTAEGPAMAAGDGSRAADTVAPEAAGNANEAFLVNGSLSSGLDAPGQQGPFDRFLAVAIAGREGPAECRRFSVATLLPLRAWVEAVLPAADSAAVTAAPEGLAAIVAEAAEVPPARASAIGVEAAAAVCVAASI